MLSKLLRQLVSRRFGFRKTAFADVYALYEDGRLAQAERACAAIADASGADIAFLRGLIARKGGDLDSAASAMAEAVARREGEPAFYFNFGEVLAGLGRHEDAVEQFQAAAECSGADPTLQEKALVAAGRSSAAFKATTRASGYFERALALSPDNAETAELLASTQYNTGRIDEAREALTVAIDARKPGMSLRRALMLPSVYRSQAEIDEVRERFSADLDEVLASPQPRVDDPATDIRLTAFRLAYHNRNNADLLAKLCRATRSVCGIEPRELPARRRAGRLRIGFVSTFFHLHSIGRITIGLIRDFPRDRFSTHVFAIKPRKDELRDAIAQAADHYHELPESLDAARRAIESAELDILLFPDIGMHPLTYFLALQRLAPVQAVTWGHPETTGIDSIDYYLSARGLEIESAQAHYTEALVQPDVFFLSGYARASLESPLSRSDLGLPENARLYACLQTLFKFHPDFDAVFAGVLERDPAAQIVLIDSDPADAERLRERFRISLGAHSTRVRFLPGMPQQRYLATLAASDVALDPLYFGGGNTSCDAIAMGVPLVTLPGAHLYGRLTLGLYREMGTDYCVARSVGEYVDIACRIACDPDLRRDLSREIAAHSEVVFERKDITLAYADFLEGIVRGEAGATC